MPFNFDANADIRKLRIGYLSNRYFNEIEDDPENPERVEQQRENNLCALLPDNERNMADTLFKSGRGMPNEIAGTHDSRDITEKNQVQG